MGPHPVAPAGQRPDHRSRRPIATRRARFAVGLIGVVLALGACGSAPAPTPIAATAAPPVVTAAPAAVATPHATAAGSTTPSNSAATTPAAAASVAPSASAALPDGTYTTGPIPTAVVIAAIKAGGQDLTQFTELVGHTTVTFTLKFQADAMVLFVGWDGGPEAVGDTYTYSVPDDHTIVANDGSVQTYDFALVGPKLTMRFVSITAGDAAAPAHAVGIFNTAPFILVPAAASLPSATPISSSVAAAPAFQPTFAAAPCPADVSVQILTPATCGQLTVLEDRSKPAGRQITLFVLRSDPPGGATAPDPVLAVGTSLANLTEYGSLAVAGQGAHRTTYVMDPRGVGHSVPNLDCPEVRAVAPALLDLRLSDPAHGTTFLAAVQACHDRLTGSGIDLAAYDIAASADDIADLATALRIPRWNLVTFGSAGRVALEVAAGHPDLVRSLVLTSPLLAGSDPFSGAAASTQAAIGRVAAACAADSACHAKWPDLGASIDQAIAKLDASPVTIAATSSSGAPMPLLFDGATLLRAIRKMIGANGGSGIGQIPATISHVLSGALAATDPAVTFIASDTGACQAWWPGCPAISLGLAYSITCRDFAPGVDQAALAKLSGVAWAEAFGHDPFLAACPVWAVAPAPAVASSAASNVPLLLVQGGFDPYSASYAALRADLESFSHAYIVSVPNASYDAFEAGQCLVQLRNDWVSTPDRPPPDPASCVASIPKPRFVP